jgi:hypothetical protein
MIRACCPECRLRCSPAAGMYLEACPECGHSLQPASGLRDVVGFRLLSLEALPPVAPESVAVAISLGLPDPNERRT